jgi:hypothetical protein
MSKRRVYVSVLLDLSVDINNSAFGELWRLFECSRCKQFAVAHADTDSNTARANSANIAHTYAYSHTYSHTHSHTRACRFTQADQRKFG